MVIMGFLFTILIGSIIMILGMIGTHKVLNGDMEQSPSNIAYGLIFMFVGAGMLNFAISSSPLALPI